MYVCMCMYIYIYLYTFTNGLMATVAPAGDFRCGPGPRVFPSHAPALTWRATNVARDVWAPQGPWGPWGPWGRTALGSGRIHL